MIGLLLGFAVSTAIFVLGFTRTRRFVVNHPIAPIVAAVGAVAIATPVVALLPLVGFGTALTFGVSVGLGVAAGRSEIQRTLPPMT